MKVTDFSIQQESSHFYFEKHVQRESLTYLRPENVSGSVINRRDDGLDVENSIDSQQIISAQVNLSNLSISRTPIKAVARTMTVEESVVADLNMRILQEMIERITGKKIKILNTQDIEGLQKNSDVDVLEGNQENSDILDVNDDLAGTIYDYYESHHEYETSEFTSEGVVQTEDGREIDISIKLNLSREFYSENSLQVRTGTALKDPLVLNFDGNSVGLTERNFEFDIDADGKTDQIAFANTHSGLLALDRNNDGKVNDGTELFGAISGDGFGELSEFDKDTNGWIDENDSIYDNLRIWMKVGEDQQLVGLGEKGIGAIYLGNVATPFLLKDENNVIEAKVRNSGIFLNEDGTAGTVQQIDLVA